MTDTLGRAREMLAAEYELGWPREATRITSGISLTQAEKLAINAIAKALTREPSEADVERVRRAMNRAVENDTMTAIQIIANRDDILARAAITAMAPGSGGMRERL